MSRIRSRPSGIRHSLIDRLVDLPRHGRQSSFDSQNLPFKLSNDKENLYPKLELEKKNNNPLTLERNQNGLSKFCQKLESLENKLHRHYSCVKSTEINIKLFEDSFNFDKIVNN